MKKLIFLTTACIFTFNTSLKSLTLKDDHGNKYCCKKKEGKMCVMHEGTVITTEATLDNGTMVKPDGTVIKKDGSKMMLKDGECIAMDGKMMMESKHMGKDKDKHMDKNMDKNNK